MHKAHRDIIDIWEEQRSRRTEPGDGWNVAESKRKKLPYEEATDTKRRRTEDHRDRVQNRRLAETLAKAT